MISIETVGILKDRVSYILALDVECGRSVTAVFDAIQEQFEGAPAAFHVRLLNMDPEGTRQISRSSPVL